MSDQFFNMYTRISFYKNLFYKNHEAEIFKFLKTNLEDIYKNVKRNDKNKEDTFKSILRQKFRGVKVSVFHNKN